MLYDAAAEIERLRDLLKIAKCPNANCDNNGTICNGEYDHGNGEIEYDLEQCEWCDERFRVLEAAGESVD
jgi:hypothetical protein